MEQTLVKAPILETSRLTLQGHTPEDFESCATMWGDINFVKYTFRVPSTREESWTRFLRYFGHWQVNGFGYWVIKDRSTGEFIGEAGFADYKRNMTPSIEGRPEAGWGIASHQQGKGYASEAMTCITQWADSHLSAATTVCIIDPEHQASIRVANKMGYHPIGIASYLGDNVNLYERKSA